MVYDAVSKQGNKMLSLEPFRKVIGNRIDNINQIKTDISIQFNDNLPTLSQATEILIEEALKKARGNKTIAANILGISHQALSKRLIRKNNKN
jgi:transcriptional regulator with PAS, ATPase and Fis domain